MRVLVVASHPDDEILGCGGTIAKHVESGDEVFNLILAEGATSRQVKRDREKIAEYLNDLANNAIEAGKVLGVKNVDLLNFPDNRLDSIDRIEIVKVIENKIKLYEPDLIYTHHSGDVNIDHRRVHEALITSCRPLPGNKVKRIVSFETPSSTEWQPPDSNIFFKPNWFVDISEHINKKIKALELYNSEMREFPHPRSIENIVNLAKVRGAQVGLKYAEAFVLLRNIEF